MHDHRVELHFDAHTDVGAVVWGGPGDPCAKSVDSFQGNQIDNLGNF